MNRHHIRLCVACLIVPIAVSTCGKLLAGPARPTISDTAAEQLATTDTAWWDGATDVTDPALAYGVDPTLDVPLVDPTTGLVASTDSTTAFPMDTPSGSAYDLPTGSFPGATPDPYAGDPSIPDSWASPDLPRSTENDPPPSPAIDTPDAAPEPADPHPSLPETPQEAAPDPQPTPQLAPQPTPEPIARAVAVNTGCGRLQVGLPDPAGWRNATWMSGSNQQMNILGLGWNPASAIGVLTGSSAFWVSVGCGTTPSVELAETYLITTCGTLRITNGSSAGSRNVSWHSDRVGGASMLLGTNGWSTESRHSMITNGLPFNVSVSCGPTQTQSVQ